MEAEIITMLERFKPCTSPFCTENPLYIEKELKDGNAIIPTIKRGTQCLAITIMNYRYEIYNGYYCPDCTVAIMKKLKIQFDPRLVALQ